MSARLHVALLTAALTLPCVVSAGTEADAYLQGYVSATLAPDQPPRTVLAVRDGVVLLDRDAVRSEERSRIEERVEAIDRVRDVEWVASSDPRVRESQSLAGTEVAAALDPMEQDGFVVLPTSSIFEPLAADPRWPRFSASYQRYRNETRGVRGRARSDDELRKVGAASLGGTLPVVQGELPGEGRWDLAIQGSVFSIFDLDTSSLDLVNSDFFVALPISTRWGPFSLMVRPYHQSSHLGDEFLLRDRNERIDVSVEAADALISIDLWDWGRIYGGGGYFFNTKPSDIEEKTIQAGIELKSPFAFFDGRMRPFAALDVQRAEENDYRSDYSTRLGIQLENPRLLRGRRMQIYGEYYKGFSPNGQFFNRQIEYFGGGFQFFF
jgi:hypothetical protein